MITVPSELARLTLTQPGAARPSRYQEALGSYQMSDTSIVNAKARLPSLVQRAEAGEPVHITRRGKRVAVILSEQEFSRLTNAPPKRTAYLDFLASWRKRLQEDECEPLTDQEVASLRSQ